MPEPHCDPPPRPVLASRRPAGRTQHRRDRWRVQLTITAATRALRARRGRLRIAAPARRCRIVRSGPPAALEAALARRLGAWLCRLAAVHRAEDVLDQVRDADFVAGATERRSGVRRKDPVNVGQRRGRSVLRRPCPLPGAQDHALVDQAPAARRPVGRRQSAVRRRGVRLQRATAACDGSARRQRTEARHPPRPRRRPCRHRLGA